MFRLHWRIYILIVNLDEPSKVKESQIFCLSVRETGKVIARVKSEMFSRPSTVRRRRNVTVFSPLSLLISRTRGERIATYACAGSMSPRVCVVTYVRASVCAVTCKNGIAKT